MREEGRAVSGEAPACKKEAEGRLLVAESGFIGPRVAVTELLPGWCTGG